MGDGVGQTRLNAPPRIHRPNGRPWFSGEKIFTKRQRETAEFLPFFSGLAFRGTPKKTRAWFRAGLLYI